MDFSSLFFKEVTAISESIDTQKIESLANDLAALRDRSGRLFFLGVGGSAANCSHAVNDFRKLCGIEAYTPVDNVSELTARTNDEGWDTIFSEWLIGSNASSKDALFILSVGGGDAEANISPNLIKAIEEAKERGLSVFGIVGNENGYTAQHGDNVITIPVVNPNHRTPHSEAFQAVVWHCLVSNPKVKKRVTKWESLLEPVLV